MADPFDPVGPPNGKGEGPVVHKIVWFILLAAGGVLAVAAIAYILRALLFIGPS